MLRLAPGTTDVEVFERCLGRARQQWSTGDLRVAIGTFGEALALWRGPPFSGACGPFAEAQRARLSEVRLTAMEDRAEVMLAAGRQAEIVADLADLTRDHPLRERAHGLLMLALCRCGRQAEALEAFTHVRRLLIDELGIEPNPRLQRIHQQILAGKAEPAWPRRAVHSHDSPTAANGAAPAGHVPHRDTPEPAPKQLPRDTPGFTGRRAELGQLHDLFLAPETGPSGTAALIGVISGTAGVGKTSLAVHWAYQVAERFPDGQLYLNLRGFDSRQPPLPPSEALSSLLRGLGVAPQRIPSDNDDQAAMLRTLLARKRMLLVLDNAATAQQLRPLLPGSPGCLVLVTSRNDLSGLVARDGAHRIPLEVLSTDESITVLASIIGAERIRAEPQAAEELARLCDGLPLALRIAAERVAGRTRQATLAELAAELVAENRRLDLLAADEDEDTAVRPVFSWSYRALRPQLARMFRLLGLHAGPELSASAAAALAGSTTARVRPLLTTLVRKNLLDEVARDRYRLHDLLRIYATERVTAERPSRDRDTAIQRMLIWYLHTADNAASVLATYHRSLPLTPLNGTCPPLTFTSHQEALGWLECERTNLIAAARQAAETGHHALAWQLPTTLWEFFNLRKHWTDWSTTGHIGLAAARLLGDREGEGRMLGSLGILNWDLGRYEEAASQFQASIDIWRERGNRSAEGRCLIGLGNACQGLRRYEEALTYHRRALAACREAGDRWGESLTLTCLSTVYQNLRRYEDAIGNYQDTLVIYREIGDRWGEGATLSFLGEVYRKLGRYRDAIHQHQLALPIRRDIGDQRGEARTLRKLADVYRDLGRYREAIDHYQQALSISQEIGDQHAETRTRESIERATKAEAESQMSRTKATG